MSCQIRGSVGAQFETIGPPKLCPFQAKFAVFVEGLSAVYCCASHSKDMLKFWGKVYEVKTQPV